jgi:hypothetical protein
VSCGDEIREALVLREVSLLPATHLLVRVHLLWTSVHSQRNFQSSASYCTGCVRIIRRPAGGSFLAPLRPQVMRRYRLTKNMQVHLRRRHADFTVFQDTPFDRPTGYDSSRRPPSRCSDLLISHLPLPNWRAKNTLAPRVKLPERGSRARIAGGIRHGSDVQRRVILLSANVWLVPAAVLSGSCGPRLQIRYVAPAPAALMRYVCSQLCMLRALLSNR